MMDSFDGLIDLFRNPKTMDLIHRLDELRRRLIVTIIIVTIIFGCAFAFANHILNFLKWPLEQAVSSEQAMLHFTGPMDVLLISMRVSFFTAIIVATPFWVYQIFAFLSPALSPGHRRWVPVFALASMLLFLSGTAFCFFFMMPPALTYLVGLGQGVATAMLTVIDYLGLLIITCLAMGLAFQTPMVLILLALFDIISVELLSKNRRLVFIIILVIAAVATPSPDPFSQLAMAIPMYLLFELAIVVIKLMNRYREQAHGVVTVKNNEG